jgi:hypothetical protein
MFDCDFILSNWSNQKDIFQPRTITIVFLKKKQALFDGHIIPYRQLEK